MENQPEYVSSNFHRLQVTKGKWNAREKARKRYVKIIHCSRWEIFFRCKYFRPREKRFLRNENDDSRSKIYAGISRHCWSVRFLRIRTARRERARRDKTYATRLWYTSRGSRICLGFARLLKIFPVRRVQKKFPRAGKLPRTGKEDATNFCLRRRRLPRTYSSRMNHNAWAPSKTDSADIKFPRHRWPLDRLSRMATMREITCSHDIFILCARDFFF